MCGARSAPHFFIADQNQCPFGSCCLLFSGLNLEAFAHMALTAPTSRLLRDHGLWADRSVPGRDVPDQDPLYLDVAALSHRQWLVRWYAATARNRDRGRDRRYLCRPLVSDRRLGADAGHWADLPERHQRCRYHHQFRREYSKGPATGLKPSQAKPAADHSAAGFAVSR